MFGPVPVLAIAAVALPVAVVAGLSLTWWRRRHDRTTRDAWLDALLIGWLVAVGIATLSPVSRFLTFEGRPDVVLAPFERLPGAPEAYALGNFFLLVPLAVLLVLRGRRRRIVSSLLVCVGVSLSIETAQLLHPDRVTNVDDLVLNSLGAVIGVVVGAVLRLLRHRSPWEATPDPPRARRGRRRIARTDDEP